jgi:hypothetical protein
MKLNTVKILQAGGYINYQPIPTPPQQQAQEPQQAGAQQPEEDSYLDKNVMEKMLGKGITTDVMQYSGELQQAYQQYQYMTDIQRNSYKGRQIRQMLKGDLGQLNALMRSKDTFDESIKNAKSNDSLDEYAVTNNGMVVRDNETGKVNTVTFAQYAQDNANGQGKKYTAITNAQLAEQREYNKDLIGNSSVFSILNFGKGMAKVQDEVYKIVSTIGHSSSTTVNGSFLSNDPENVKELLSAARSGAFKIKSGESSETNAPQIQAAKQALWYNLSENSKAVLRARAAATTSDPSKIDNLAQNMMGSLLDPHTTTSSSKTYDESMKGRIGSGSGGSNKLVDLGPNGMAFTGGANTVPIGMIGPTKVKIQGYANALPATDYTGKDGARVPLRNAEKINNISYISKAFAANGDKVDPDATVITGDAYHTILPVTKDENGNMKIDQEGAKKYAEYKKALQEHGIAEKTPQGQQLRVEMGIQNLTLQDLVVAEATSIDPKNFFSDRDEDYYKPVSSKTRETIRDLVDPTGSTKHLLWKNNDAHEHLIFLPSKDLSSYNDLDKNYAKVPESVYSLGNGYNTGRGGANILQGNNTQSAAELQMNAGYLNNK